MGVNEEFDEMLHEIGGCGLYQIRQYMLVSLAIIFSAVGMMGYVFIAAIVPHRCLIESCGDVNESSPFSPPWLKDAVPFERSGKPAACYMFSNSNDSCAFDRSTQRRCNEWVFSGPERSIQHEFLLTCSENEWKLALVGTFHNFGSMIGMPISGFISDKYGRKTALVLALFLSGVFGMMKTLATSYEIFVTLETIEAIFGGNIYSTCFILALEMVTPGHRVVGFMVIVFAYACGNVLVGAAAWFFKDWSSILLVLNAPALLFIFYIRLVPESVRWLLSRGRLADAKKVVKYAAKLNCVELSEERMKDWKNDQANRVDVEFSENGDSLWTSFVQVTKSRILLLRLILTSYLWTASNLVFYGLSLNSVSLAGTENQYLNFILTGLVEAPSYIITWQCMNRLGRRRTLCIMFAASSFACFANPFIPKEAGSARLGVYLFGKFAITGAYDTVYISTAEIFPTTLRTSLLGICLMVGRSGAMLAPLTPLLTQFSKFLPLALFGAAALLAAAMALFLPETKGLALPVSIKEAEDLSRQAEQAAGIEKKSEMTKC
ncbi:Hypothetical predicted protein [Cloeon dipterum]|uniref:Major facilitator superfamily (MFS) profile domain-containing protein n=1 Tax=Cloeon dipterum TaxID=197152 RepID=A0A8S1CF09_9INSE|nr:Hypothetical predicted protein [Cloeon dipterum]